MVRIGLIGCWSSLKHENLDRRMTFACNGGKCFLLVVIQRIAKNKEIIGVVAHQLDTFSKSTSGLNREVRAQHHRACPKQRLIPTCDEQSSPRGHVFSLAKRKSGYNSEFP